MVDVKWEGADKPSTESWVLESMEGRLGAWPYPVGMLAATKKAQKRVVAN